MGSALSQEFNKLPEHERVREVMGLVRLCSYPQQLELLEGIQKLLHKDILGDLPPDLTWRILNYLSVEEACNCMMVCKKWRDVISSCVGYWEASARNIGVSEAFIKENISKFKTLKDLCVAASNHQNYVSSLAVRPMTLARSPKGARHSYHYAGRGVILRHEESNAHAQITIEKMTPSNSLTQVCSITTSSFSSRIKWSGASETHVLWKQTDGKWNSFNMQAVGSSVQHWDDEPVSQTFHSITFCSACHLVAILSEAEDDCEVWDLQVVKLVQRKTAAKKTVYPIPIEHMQKTGPKIRHYLGGEITLIPERKAKSGKGFCETHKILLQVDNCVAVHRLESIPPSPLSSITSLLLPDVKLSKPLHIFEPITMLSLIDASDNMGGSKGPSKFVLSSDFKRIGVLHENYLHVWNLSTYFSETSVDLIELSLPNDTHCIALGSMYAILVSNSHGTCYVIAIQSGSLLADGCLADITFNPTSQHVSRFMFYSPLEESWLSSMRYFDFWPLAIVFDSPSHLESASELQAVVGICNRHHRPRGFSSSFSSQ